MYLFIAYIKAYFIVITLMVIIFKYILYIYFKIIKAFIALGEG